MRVNGYVPTKDDELVSSFSTQAVAGSTIAPTVSLSGSNLVMTSGGFTTTTTTFYQQRELALWGFDGEVGLKVPLNLDDDRNELRLYAGGYYFDHADLRETVAGPKARLEFRINDVIPNWAGSRLTLETEYRWDEVRDNQIEGGLRLRLPFGGGEGSRQATALNAQERRMAEGLERDTDIITNTVATATDSSSVTTGTAFVSEKVKDAATQVVFDRAVVAANGSNLQTQVTAAGANSLIIAQGGATDFGPVVLTTDQTLQGGGSTLLVTGVTTGQTAGYTADGSRPTLAGSPGGAVITVGEKSHILGADLETGAAGSGVLLASSSTLVVVEQTSITGTSQATDAGIVISGNTTTVGNFLVHDVEATNLVAFLATTPSAPSNPEIGTLDVADVAITDTQFGFLVTGADNFFITDVTQTGGQSGAFVSLSKNLVIDNFDMNLASKSNTGIALFSGVTKALIKDVAIDGASTAVSYQGVGNIASKDVVIDNLTVTNSISGIVGTAVGAFQGDITIKNSSFKDVSGHGILLQRQPWARR